MSSCRELLGDTSARSDEPDGEKHSWGSSGDSGSHSSGTPQRLNPSFGMHRGDALSEMGSVGNLHGHGQQRAVLVTETGSRAPNARRHEALHSLCSTASPQNRHHDDDRDGAHIDGVPHDRGITPLSTHHIAGRLATLDGAIEANGHHDAGPAACPRTAPSGTFLDHHHQHPDQQQRMWIMSLGMSVPASASASTSPMPSEAPSFLLAGESPVGPGLLLPQPPPRDGELTGDVPGPRRSSSSGSSFGRDGLEGRGAAPEPATATAAVAAAAALAAMYRPPIEASLQQPVALPASQPRALCRGDSHDASGCFSIENDC